MKRYQIVSPEALSFSVLVIALIIGGCSAENSSNRADYIMTTGGLENLGVDPNAEQMVGYGGDQVVPTEQVPADDTKPAVWEVGIDGGDLAEKCATFSDTAKRMERQVEVLVPVEVVDEIVEVVTEEVPVAIYIMLDQSGSMWIPDAISMVEGIVVDPNTMWDSFKWVAASDSINTFVNDPNSAGFNVALQYFPLVGGGCDGTMYDTPAVPMGRLPGNATALSNSLAGVFSIGNDTPIEGALRGATNYCKRYKNDPALNPDGEDCAVVFITDGLPSACDQNITNLANIVGEAYRNDGIRTFAVGMAGADFNMLNMMAEQGQGDNDCHPDDPLFYCCNVSANMTLLQALETIRGFVSREITHEVVRTETHVEYETVVETEALDCEWQIPDPPEHEAFNKDKVNVHFSPTGSPDNSTIIPMVASQDKCGAVAAWHYDNPANPTRIIACPETCNVIKAAELGTINIVLGCQVVVIE